MSGRLGHRPHVGWVESTTERGEPEVTVGLLDVGEAIVLRGVAATVWCEAMRGASPSEVVDRAVACADPVGGDDQVETDVRSVLHQLLDSGVLVLTRDERRAGGAD